MIKKSLTVIAGGLLVANVASATELYNQNGTTFSVGGYLKIGYQSSAKDLDGKMGNVNGKYNNTRINFGGTRTINDDLTAFGKVEWKVNLFDKAGDVSMNNSEGVVTNRLGYVGLDHKSFGKITFGKQWGTYYNVASFTDLYEITGNEATGVYGSAQNGDGGFIGTGRAGSALKYDVKMGSTELSAQYQAQETASSVDSFKGYIERKYSFGASVVQGLGDNLKVGIAGNYAKLNAPLTSTDVNLDRMSAVAGVSYASDMLMAAVTVSYNTNMYNMDVSESATIGQESFVGVKIGQPTLVYVGNNYSTTSYDNAKDGRTFSNTTDYNYVAVGAKYDLSADVSLSAEYRYDLRSKETVEKAGATTNMNNVAVAVKYNF